MLRMQVEVCFGDLSYVRIKVSVARVARTYTVRADFSIRCSIIVTSIFVLWHVNATIKDCVCNVDPFGTKLAGD